MQKQKRQPRGRYIENGSGHHFSVLALMTAPLSHVLFVGAVVLLASTAHAQLPIVLLLVGVDVGYGDLSSWGKSQAIF